jgi:pimeloyl-ACP methyl ester carboxylesterase
MEGAVMNEHRIHRAVPHDGTEIAGRVHGHGPPLALIHGGLGDGDTAWLFMLPVLAEHFTCYLMSTRGRGLSGKHPDQSRERHFEDVAAFAESIGEPVGVVGHSSGAVWALGGVALAPGAVRAVALYEPPLALDRPVAGEAAIEAIARTAADGRLAEAALMLIDEAVKPTAEERALFSASEVAALAGAYVTVALPELPELNRPFDTVPIEKLTMPVLLIQGSRTAKHFKDAVRHLSGRLDDCRVIEVQDVAHLGHVTAPNAIAQELVRYFGQRPHDSGPAAATFLRRQA